MDDCKLYKIKCANCSKKFIVVSHYAGDYAGYYPRCLACSKPIDVGSAIAEQIAEEERNESERETQKKLDELKCCLSRCDRCGENLWELISVSPNKTAYEFKCGYCKKIQLIRDPALIDKVTPSISREPIPRPVQREVWQRDSGRCVECGSNEKLEFDHISRSRKAGRIR